MKSLTQAGNDFLERLTDKGVSNEDRARMIVNVITALLYGMTNGNADMAEEGLDFMCEAIRADLRALPTIDQIKKENARGLH